MLAFAGALAVAGCGSSGDSGDSGSSGSEGGSSDPLKIGMVMGFTGPTNGFDGPVANGVKVAVDDFNAEGGIDGRKIELIESDTKSDIKQVPAAAQAALDKGAEVIITSCDYDFGGPAAREATKVGKFAIGCAGDPLFGREGLGELTFNTLGPTPVEAGVIAATAEEQGWKNAFLLQDTSIQYSKRGCTYIDEALKASGVGIADTETFLNSDSSISPQVSAIKSSDADVVVLCSYNPGATSAVRQIRAAGIDLPIMGMVGGDGRVISGGVKNLNDYYYLSAGSLRADSPNKRQRELGKAYDELTNGGLAESPDGQPLMGYAAIETIAKAIEGAGSTDGQAMADIVKKFDNEELITGPTSYSEECHTPFERPFAVATVENGKASIVEERVTPINVPDSPC
ncbi:MAG: ABC transporter substrate-binding protein [Actinomycetota bacterium]|nr:ABC transporter substrate-binding protein [Actinomycetota bacterium]